MNTSKFLLLLTTLIVGSVCYCQSNSSAGVPPNVKSAFKKKFPSAGSVSWVNEANSNYEAKFTMNNVRERAEFDQSGAWVETENTIKTSDLPKAVKDAVTQKSPACKISEAEKVQTANKGTEYDVGCIVNAAKIEYRVTADGSTETAIEKK